MKSLLSLITLICAVPVWGYQIKITIYKEGGILASGIEIRAYSDENVLIYTGITDKTGSVVFESELKEVLLDVRTNDLDYESEIIQISATKKKEDIAESYYLHRRSAENVLIMKRAMSDVTATEIPVDSTCGHPDSLQVHGEERKLFLRKLAETVRYPQSAIENGAQGKVYLEMLVTSEGEIRNVVVKKGVYAALDEEAILSLGKINHIEPIICKGEKRARFVRMPIGFKLM